MSVSLSGTSFNVSPTSSNEQLIDGSARRDYREYCNMKNVAKGIIIAGIAAVCIGYTVCLYGIEQKEEPIFRAVTVLEPEKMDLLTNASLTTVGKIALAGCLTLFSGVVLLAGGASLLVIETYRRV